MTIANFTLAYWCVLVAALLPVVCAGIAKKGTFSTSAHDGGYDNHNPRANAAQANTFEALPFFFAAVIIAHQLQARQAWLDGLAILFVVLRMAYIALYVGDKPNVRSAVWALAFFANIGILFLAYR